MEKKLGIEIEFTGVTREEVVKALEYLFENPAERVWNSRVEEPYAYYRIKDKNGDTWLVVRDRSIKGQVFCEKLGYTVSNYRFSNTMKEDSSYKCELVSPVLTSKSLPILFSVLDVIKSLGGIVNFSCGIHVHIDAPDTLEELWSLFSKFCVQQSKLIEDFNIGDYRLNNYCKMYDYYPDSADEFESIDDFLEYLYDRYAERYGDGSINKRTLRYYGLNLHSIKCHNTVEFRIFNSSLDKVEVAKILNWVINFAYAPSDSMGYISVLGNILMNEIK